MISFADILKGNILAEFSAISAGGILSAIGLAFVLSLFIVLIYRLTYNGQTVTVPAKTQAPESTVIDGKRVVAWQYGDKTVAVGDEMAVAVHAAEGEKCQRCWKFHTAVDANGLCPRCAGVVPAVEVE